MQPRGSALPEPHITVNGRSRPLAGVPAHTNALDGQEVVTAEGLGSPARLHPVQAELAERGGSQCGYCTPGFVCSMAAEYYRPRRATAGSTDGVHSSTPFDVEALSGNLCRCTGYRPIRDAALTLSELERLLAGRVPLLDEVWPQFASRLIRNGATLGGNLGTASPIGDTAPALLALEATLLLVSRRGEREVPLGDFFTGYRRTLRERDELIRAARIPLPLSSVVCFHKVAKRRADDISSVAVALALDIGGGVVRRARIGLGGVAATPLRALATEGTLEGRPWTAETALTAAEVLAAEGTPIDDVRASAAYRAAMLRNALLRLAVERGGLEVRLPAAG